MLCHHHLQAEVDQESSTETDMKAEEDGVKMKEEEAGNTEEDSVDVTEAATD